MAATDNKSVKPTELTVHSQSRLLEVAFEDGQRFSLPFEYLRVHSPSAEVQGHHPSQRILQTGKRNVGVENIVPVGNYAVAIHFDDGHSTGIYTWRNLYALGANYDENWQNYLNELEAAGASRDS